MKITVDKNLMLALFIISAVVGFFSTFLANTILAWGNRMIGFDILSGVSTIIAAILLVIYILAEPKSKSRKV